MKIGILGTRGIPNYYGGFEQFAEYFAVYLQKSGHEVYVYNSSTHPHQESTFKGVNIVHCYDPENRIGTAGQFIYDLNCILDSRKRDFDILLQLGYTSSSIWYHLLPSKTLAITNMDGLEWKRTKYSKIVQKFLKYAEKWAVISSDYLVADSLGIQDYLKRKYNIHSKYIAYGADIFQEPSDKLLNEHHLESLGYNMLIARLEPENNIETILNGVAMATTKQPFLVIGKYQGTKFGEYLVSKFKDHKHIRFLGGIYDQQALNNLRYYSNLYFHGHSVGGTNPSLLEAMASNTLIIAHDNPFNGAILKDHAFYFTKSTDVQNFVDTLNKLNYLDKVEKCKAEITNNYSWDLINKQYLNYFEECYNNNK